jgi:hypothetical protein
MTNFDLEQLYREQSIFTPEAKEAAKEWADEIRPGLKSPDGLIADEDRRRGPSPLQELENRVSKFGVTSSQSLAELAFIGLDLSRKSEMEKK